jgi:hypothetical protein
MKTETIKSQVIYRGYKVCSTYDEECKDVIDPVKCFLGEMPCPISKTAFGIADGICPELRRYR